MARAVAGLVVFLQLVAALPSGQRANAPTCPDGPVIIVGAGMSGLAAAETLAKFGCQYIALEAGSYVGGRTQSFRSGEFAGQDIGAHWIHGGAKNPVVSKLVRALGVKVVTVGGDEIYEGGDAALHDSDGAVVNETVFDQGFAAIANESAALEDFQANRDDHHLPDITAQEGLDAIAQQANYTPLEQRLIGWHRSLIYEGGEGDSPRELSLRAYIDDDYEEFYMGKVRHRGSSGDQVIVGGFAALVDAYAAANDIKVELNALVTQISLVGDRVVVATSVGMFEGAAVIVTVPVSVLQHSGVVFSPPLESNLTQAFTQMSLGSFTKLMLKFPNTFWNKTAYSEGFMSGNLQHNGNFPSFISSARETSAGENMLVCYIGGDMSRVLNTQTDSEVVAAAVRVLESMYPAAKPISPVASFVGRWDTHPFVQGAWSHVNLNGSNEVMRSIIAKPQWNNRLAFAGEHTCYLFSATVHGALVSGVRAAAMVMGVSGSRGASRGGEQGERSLLWEFRDWCEQGPAGVKARRRG